MDISVIIPVYNSEKYLQKCLESLFLQDFKGKYDVLIAYDPSTDKSLEIISSFKNKHDNLKLIECNGLGLALSRLYALKQSDAKYICFLDSDDYYKENYLSTLFKEIEKGYDIVNCSFFNVRKNKIKKDLFKKEVTYNSINGCKALLSDISMRSFLWNKIFKRELFLLDGLIIPKCKKPIFEDSMMLFDLFMKAKKIRSIKTPLYFYRDNKESATKKENKDRFNYHLYAFFMMRHLCDLSNDKKYLKVFLKKWKRCKFSLWFDVYTSRHVLNTRVIKYISSHKNEYKIIKQKSPIDINKLPWANYLLDAKKPLDF